MVMSLSSSKHDGWLEIAIDIHPVAHEALSAFLFDLGCQGLVSEDFTGHTLKAYWPFRENSENLRNRINGFLTELEGIFPEAHSSNLRLCNLQDRDWGHSWRRFFHPDRVTPNLTIFPAWEPIPKATKGEVIRIDPGPAFGTGQHPTTRMCLRAMEKAPLPGPWSMLDVGTGSGILALYGARLRASRILAIDTDTEALRWARRNLSLNVQSGVIELASGLLEALDERFDLTVANLILGTIVDLLPYFPSVMKQAGMLILSGILREQVTRVETLLPQHGLKTVEVLYEKEWACIMAKKGVVTTQLDRL